MRLLNTKTIRFTSFPNPSERPAYAILSHVWQDVEQSYQEVEALSHAPDPRLRLSAKIQSFCQFTRQEGFDWIWIDACCIDKTSSAELSEAINSMYRWYSEAVTCYVYLHDVSMGFGLSSDFQLTSSVWFTRGWTLQELISPSSVVFLDDNWLIIGTKEQWAPTLESHTGIDHAILTHTTPLSEISVARRMSWASNRRTTRPEDRAYSLMGLFDVHMTAIYGEGETKAFRRLQEEIIKQCAPDQSIFAWGRLDFYDVAMLQLPRNLPSSPRAIMSSKEHSIHQSSISQALLAPSLECFQDTRDVVPLRPSRIARILGLSIPLEPLDIRISGAGVLVTLSLIPMEDHHPTISYLAILACQHLKYPDSLCCLCLTRRLGGVASTELYAVGAYTPVNHPDDVVHGPRPADAPLLFDYKRGGMLYSTLGQMLHSGRATTIHIVAHIDRPVYRETSPCIHPALLADLNTARRLSPRGSDDTSSVSRLPPWRLSFMHHSLVSNGFGFVTPPFNYSSITKGWDIDIPRDPGFTNVVLKHVNIMGATDHYVKLVIGTSCVCAMTHPFWIQVAHTARTPSAGGRGAVSTGWMATSASVVDMRKVGRPNVEQQQATIPLQVCSMRRWHIPPYISTANGRRFSVGDPATHRALASLQNPFPYPSTCFQFASKNANSYSLRVIFDHWPSYTSPQPTGANSEAKPTIVLKYGIRVLLGPDLLIQRIADTKKVPLMRHPRRLKGSRRERGDSVDGHMADTE